MDLQSEDILKQILERLDKMDNQHQKLDRVMERLDTLQNIIEGQNQKQNLLDEKLVAVTLNLHQEKTDMTEQLQESLREIVEAVRVTESQKVCTSSPHKNTQVLQGLGTQIGLKLKSIDDRTVDTAEKCYQLISWSRKMEDKMTQIADNSVEMKTFLVEMRSVKDLIKGQTNCELIWLNNQLDKKLSEIGSFVRDIHQQQTKAKLETVRSEVQIAKTDIEHGKQQSNTNDALSFKQQLSTEMCDRQMKAILDLDSKIEKLNSSVLDVSRDVKISLDTILTTNKQLVTDMENIISNSVDQINQSSREQPHLINEELQSDLHKLLEAVQEELRTNSKTAVTNSDTQSSRIISAVEMLKDDLKHLIQKEEDNTSKYREELGNIHSSINALLESMQGNMATVLEKVDCTETSTISRHTTVINQLEKLSTNTQVNKQLETLTSDLKDCIYLTKREIFAVTEKEAQIVRDRIQGPLQCIGKPTFDFYVNNFKSLVRSGKNLFNLPWHINELQTCMTGNVALSKNGEMEVWLVHGRHPREVGLQPRPGQTLKIKATICDIHNKKLPTLDVGEDSNFMNEANNSWNGGCGWKIGVTSCDMLLEKGYGEQEGYAHGALLIRYEVTVL